MLISNFRHSDQIRFGLWLGQYLLVFMVCVLGMLVAPALRPDNQYNSMSDTSENGEQQPWVSEGNIITRKVG